MKYANNLYAPKILRLKSTTTQHLTIFSNIRKIITNKHLYKAHTDHSKSKSAISKYLDPHIFTQNHMNLPKVPNKPKAAHKGLPPKLDLGPQKVQIEVSQEVQKWSKYPKFEVLGMGLRGSGQVLQPKGSSLQGLAAAYSQDPQKGSKMVKIRSNLGSLKGPPRSILAKGTNRHILARGRNLGLGGLKMGSK